MTSIKKVQNQPPSHEIIIGLVAGTGTNLTKIIKKLIHQFNKTNKYVSEEIRVSMLLNSMKQEYKPLKSGNKLAKIEDRISKCNQVREYTKLCEVMAILTIAEIKSRRKKINEKNAIYIVNQIKNHNEVELFRKVYGKNFILISIYEHKEKRKKNLLGFIKKWFEKYNKRVDEVIKIDECEGKKYGQNMRKAFVEADFFMNMDEINNNIDRFVRILMSYPYHTPNKDELNMGLAWLCSTRSADMSRQVGAAIANDKGETLSLGCNEVPKYNGGLFWEDDNPDLRDFQQGIDANQNLKNKVIKDAISIIDNENSDNIFNNLKEEKAEIFDIIEFCRAVHAEDSAIADSAKRGISINGSTLYCTTFPCHLCTKHIISVGITRVVYIYPYDKSRAKELFGEIIAINPIKKDMGEKIIFSHFMGVAPRKLIKVFTNIENRKDDDGNKIHWEIKNAKCDFLSRRSPLAYYDREIACLQAAYASITNLTESNGDIKLAFDNAKIEYEKMTDEKKYWAAIEYES